MSEKQRYIVYAVAGALILCVYVSTSGMRAVRKPVTAASSPGNHAPVAPAAGNPATTSEVAATESKVESATADAAEEATAVAAEETMEDIDNRAIVEEVDRLRRYQRELAAGEWPADPFAADKLWVDPALPHADSEQEQEDPGSAVNWKISGISFGRGGGHAVLNRTVVSVGDVIEGHRVVRIHKDRIELSDARGRVRIVSIDD